jgi:hypothetical protein
MPAAYRVIAIPEAVATGVRATRKSPFGNHPAHLEFATGHGPCRLCLQTFSIGQEQRILFTYDQFAGIEVMPLPGPVFIHQAECTRYAEEAGFPEGLLSHALTLTCYGRGRKLLGQEFVTDGDVEPVIERLFAGPGAEYIQVSDTQAGCYDFRIEPRRDAQDQR